jgi:putative transposase
VEEALEAEVAAAVGRDYYEPAAAGCARRRGPSSTACRRRRIGPSHLCRACGRDWRAGRRKRLALEMFARGLSTHDIEAAFWDDTGASVLSRTAVSQVTERRLWSLLLLPASRSDPVF